LRVWRRYLDRAGALAARSESVMDVLSNPMAPNTSLERTRGG